MLGGIKNRNLILVLLLALAVRLIGIEARPIWYDEAFSILFSEKGLASMLYGTLTPTGTGTADIHPLGYYFLLGGWMKLWGDSIVSVRLLSIFAGVAMIFVSYCLMRDAFGDRLAYIGSIFLAFAPFQIHYAQEIRMYSFFALWLLLATFSYWRASSGGSWRWWIIFSLSAALAQYTHNLAAFYLVPLALWPIFQRNWRTLRAVTLAGLGALVLYLPWLIHLPHQFSKVSNAYWVERPGIAKVFTLLLVYVTNLPLPDSWLPIALFIALTVTAIAVIQTVKGENRSLAGTWLLFLSFTPALMLFLVSQCIPIYIERALLPSGAIFCLWLAWVLFGTSMPKIIRNTLIGFLILSSSVGFYQHLIYREFPYAPFRELDASIRTRLVSGDVIIHSNKLSVLPAVYYDRTLPQIYIADLPGSRTDTLAEPTREILQLTAETDLESSTGNAYHVWFIIFKRAIEEAQKAGASTHLHLQYLDQHFQLIDTEDWGGLQVYYFEKKP